MLSFVCGSDFARPGRPKLCYYFFCCSNGYNKSLVVGNSHSSRKQVDKCIPLGPGNLDLLRRFRVPLGSFGHESYAPVVLSGHANHRPPSRLSMLSSSHTKQCCAPGTQFGIMWFESQLCTRPLASLVPGVVVAITCVGLEWKLNFPPGPAPSPDRHSAAPTTSISPGSKLDAYGWCGRCSSRRAR